MERGRCSICHEPHGTREPHLLARAPGELCKKCHASHENFSHPIGPNVLDPRNGKPVVCLSCHEPHGTEHPSILRQSAARALCVQCHADSESAGVRGGKAHNAGGK